MTNDFNNKRLMIGNDALCEGAVQAGCQCYFGYPITPQNEVPAYMSWRIPQVGGIFLQAESELAAINMVFGAAAVGARAMTSSSSPGISLKQEGISYLAGAELPCVIVNIMRGGPGLGNIAGSQGDYFQATRGGGHGDYRTICLAPGSVQEMMDLTREAFDLADRYRIPTLILSDGILGQMMEPVIFSNDLNLFDDLPEKDWALTGAKGRPPRVIKSLYMGEGELEERNWRLHDKHKRIEMEIPRCEYLNTEDAEFCLIAFGTAARVARSVVYLAEKEGINLGLLRPITLYPFPKRPIKELARKGVRFLVIEMNLGQMLEDCQLAVNGVTDVFFYGRPGGGIFNPEEILKVVKSYL
ncbi:3-methyl-2-oxobutanoate dehydrogenase subunit VorB [bacterium]|nr:3-methyl-2-oxobutanoate dehydrogenase subunit VorB [bacterium]